MANEITVTAANVLLNSGSPETSKNGGVAVTIGQVCYEDATAKWQPAISNGTALQAGSTELAISLNQVAAGGQLMAVAKSGTKIAFGSGVLSAGETYVVSNAVAGGIVPFSELAASNYTSIIGYAQDTSILVFSKIVTGIVRP